MQLFFFSILVQLNYNISIYGVLKSTDLANSQKCCIS